MSLELLERKLRELPEECFDEVDEFFDFILYRREQGDLKREPNDETLAALREVEEMKADSSKGKSYDDVDAMMRELLA